MATKPGSVCPLSLCRFLLTFECYVLLFTRATLIMLRYFVFVFCLLIVLYIAYVYRLSVTVKVMSICKAPIHETHLRRSDIPRIVKACPSFTCTPCFSPAIGISHTYLCLPSRSWYSFTDPGGMEGWVDLGAKVEIRTCSLEITSPALYH